MRKSTRDVKKPEVFSFPEAPSSRTLAHSDDEDDLADSSQSISKPVARKVANETSLFDSVGKGANKATEIIDIVNSNKNFGQDATRWINFYKTNKVAAMVELTNFILMAAGAKKKWIASDVDLEALEPEELDILLSAMMKTMSESEDSKQYPLSEKGKSKTVRTFRDKYQAYWAAWTERVLALPRGAAATSSNTSSSQRRADGHDILLTVIDQLVALSSMAVVNVRDAVTEAALCVSRGVLQSCAALKTEVETARRQIAAEESTKSKSVAKQNPKYQFCLQQEARAKKDLEAQWELTEKVFNSIFVHRSRDFYEEVRITAMRHLLTFVRFDPVHPVRVDALKYLGWGCGDYAAAVRLESIRAIQELVQNPEALPYLATFVQHFADRFIEIASNDIDDNVCLAMIEAMRAMQRNCLLDTLSQDKLDGVDVIVFDPSATLRVRQEALAFVMDHTEGFDEDAQADGLEGALDLLDLDQGTNKSKKRSSKGNSSHTNATANASDQAKALQRRQRIAQQLETLTEFAELHLGSLVERSYMLTEACLALKKYGMLYNWSTIVALLLRESGDLISTALPPAQAAILLRMFVHAAIDLTARRRRLNDSATALTATDKQMLECWEALNATLHTHLPTLLTRYKDNEENLVELVDLLPCVEFAGTEDRALKSLLKVVLELFASTRKESILSSLVATVCHWMRAGGTVAGTVESAVQGLVVGSYEAILQHTARLQALVDERDTGNSASASQLSGDSSKRGTKRKSSGKVDSSQTEQEEVLLALQSALTPFKLFWINLDCRPYFEQDASAMADELTELTSLIPTFTDYYTTNSHANTNTSSNATLSSVLTEACITSATAAAASIHSLVLWAYKDVLDLGKELVNKTQQAANKANKASKANKNKKGISTSQESQEEEENEDEDGSTTPEKKANKAEAKLERGISIAVDHVVALREKLLDILQTWIAAEAPTANSSASTSTSTSTSSSTSASSTAVRVTRALQLEAFRLVADLRNFFPVRESQYKYIDRLAYRPSQAILLGLRNVFDTEGARIKTQLMALNQDDLEGEKTAKNLSRALIEGLLEPLSSSLSYDVEHLNRKQAAAVIYYLLDSNALIEDKVKSFMHTLKAANFVKYLEIQLIALRDLYSECVVRPIEVRLRMEQADDPEMQDFDYADHERALQEGYHRVDVLARKLSQSLGIAKFKDDALLGLVNFFKASVDFAVQGGASSAGYVSVLHHYVKFLPVSQQREVAEHFEVALETNLDLLEDMQSLQENLAQGESGEETDQVGLVRLLEFADLIHGKARPKTARRKSNSNVNTSAVGAKRGRGQQQAQGKQSQNKQQQLELALSSQVLQDEDLALVQGGRYHHSQQQAANKNSAKNKVQQKAPPAKRARTSKAQENEGDEEEETVSKARGKATKGGNKRGRVSTSSNNSRRSQKQKEYDSSSSEEEESEEEEDEIEEDNDEAGEEDQVDREYAGISQVAGRGRKQSFNSRLASQTQAQTQREQSQAENSSQSQSQQQRARRVSSSSTTGTGAASGRPQQPTIVLGLDIEDIDETSFEDSQQEAGRKNTRTNTQASSGRGRLSGTSSAGNTRRGRASQQMEVEEADEPEESIDESSAQSSALEQKPPAGSRKRSRSSLTVEDVDAAPSTARGGRSTRSVASAASVSVTDTFAELDSIPSRRRLR